MHRVFQHDLYLLRLNTARSFIGALNTSSNPVSDDAQEPIKLSAQVNGNRNYKNYRIGTIG
jgi:Bardet-Biedl syndrome 1 protein